MLKFNDMYKKHGYDNNHRFKYSIGYEFVAKYPSGDDIYKIIGKEKYNEEEDEEYYNVRKIRTYNHNNHNNEREIVGESVLDLSYLEDMDDR